jgi:phosphoribosyl-ATP pyrophosphohydrolase
MSQNQLSLQELFALVKKKILSKEDGSYSYELAKKGSERTTRKVGEEALEVVIATFMHEKNPTAKTRENLIGEICDLLFHSLVLTASQEIELDEILTELTRRNNLKK